MIPELPCATIPAEGPQIPTVTGANSELVDEKAVESRQFNDVFLPNESDVSASSLGMPVPNRLTVVAVKELDGIKIFAAANTSIAATENTDIGYGYSSSRDFVMEWVAARSSRWATFEDWGRRHLSPPGEP
jgi:hypothetical protein